jgi:hypothetical protein
MAKNNKYQDLSPDDLKGHFILAEPNEEFIVSIDFTYCDVNYNGYKIVSCKNLGALIYGLKIDEEIGTSNMPGDWFGTFPMEMLRGAFKIHSYDPGDVDAMRALFGESVGEVSYFESVWQKFSDYWQDNCETDVNLLDAKVILEHADEYIFDTNCIEKFITIEAAELFSRHEEGLALDGLTELSDAVAESLSKHQGEYINLSSLTELSDAAAESLSKLKGDLALGVTEISDAAAESLSKHQGILDLSGLTDLSDAAAESLSKHQGILGLGGLTNLSNATAESLSKHQGRLGLSGLTMLSDAAAESLSKHQGALELGGLTELSDAAAESLSKHQGDLELRGLTMLSDVAAEALSKHQGDLELRALTMLSDAAAEALSAKFGKICRKDPSEWVAGLRS